MEEYFLRHFLAVLKYRCEKVIRDCPRNYPNFEVGFGVRTPIEILSHISYVIRCAQTIFNDSIIIEVELDSWETEVNRFYTDLQYLDNLIAKGLPFRERITEKLLQGPLSDAMTHVGQLSMIRRIEGTPILGESFFDVEIKFE